MRFASVCSGILGAELAWEPLGWEAAWCAEIDPFACRVIAHRRPELENIGDFTQAEPAGTVEVAAGGTPCQTFSDIGDRDGLDDPRGQLSLRFAEFARRVGARWLVWENVPGVLSSGDGADARRVLGQFAACGYYGAYRTLDAKYFGLAQQRKRVFFVGYLGDWRPSAAVLLERPNLQGHPGQRQPSGTPFVSEADRGPNSCPVSHTLLAKGQLSWDQSSETLVAHTLGTARGDIDGIGAYVGTDCPSAHGTGIRKLTPLERERLQGFPDHWTAIPGASDSARYKAIGNAFPVPVLRWIGERIQLVEQILRTSQQGASL